MDDAGDAAAALLERIREEFMLAAPPQPDDALHDDLGFDSLDQFFLVMLVEDQAGGAPTELPGEYPLLSTVADVLSYYEQLVRRGGAG